MPCLAPPRRFNVSASFFFRLIVSLLPLHPPFLGLFEQYFSTFRFEFSFVVVFPLLLLSTFSLSTVSAGRRSCPSPLPSGRHPPLHSPGHARTLVDVPLGCRRGRLGVPKVLHEALVLLLERVARGLSDAISRRLLRDVKRPKGKSEPSDTLGVRRPANVLACPMIRVNGWQFTIMRSHSELDRDQCPEQHLARVRFRYA